MTECDINAIPSTFWQGVVNSPELTDIGDYAGIKIDWRGKNGEKP